MLQTPLFSSLTRISDLNRHAFDMTPLSRHQWGTGDYVIGKVTSRGNASVPLELADGRMTEVVEGDLVVGALGVRAATLEAAGHWNQIGSDGRMQALTGAGLFGIATSVSLFIPRLLELHYVGHATREGREVRMKDFVTSRPFAHYDRPTILLIGTSMSSGKTTSARVIVRRLVKQGLTVAGVKFTGAGRLRDTLIMRDAGAASVFDFVDVGLPSTVCPADEYRDALRILLGLIQDAQPDVVVAEAGASPLEPYNGEALIDTIREQVCCTVLCASDPYAVVGVTQGFGFRPDFVSGVATSTSAGVDVIHKLTGLTALNLLDPSSYTDLDKLLGKKLALLV